MVKLKRFESLADWAGWVGGPIGCFIGLIFGTGQHLVEAVK